MPPKVSGTRASQGDFNKHSKKEVKPTKKSADPKGRMTGQNRESSSKVGGGGRRM